MPAKKNRLTPDEQRKRFEEEVRKRTADGDFDPAAAEAAVQAVVKRSRNKDC